MSQKRLGNDSFEAMYEHNADPWRFETTMYEKRTYALTFAAIPKERYRRAFEPGCANSLLTKAESFSLSVFERTS